MIAAESIATWYSSLGTLPPNVQQVRAFNRRCRAMHARGVAGVLRSGRGWCCDPATWHGADAPTVTSPAQTREERWRDAGIRMPHA